MTTKEKDRAAVADEATKVGTELTPATGKQIAAHSEMDDAMEGMASAGLENVTTKDILIPRLTILQSLSPQCVKTKPEYIPEAKTGDICDVAFKELIEAPLTFIPVYFMTQYLEWRPMRKGLAGIHNDMSILSGCTKNEKGQFVLPNGNVISETAQFFGLNVNSDYRFSFIPMTSTQLKKARFWNTLATSEKVMRKDGSGEFTPPMFYRSYILSTVPESNDQGNWDGWKIERGPKIDDMGEARQKVFQLAVDLYNNIKAGRARGDVDSMQDDVVHSSSSGQTVM